MAHHEGDALAHFGKRPPPGCGDRARRLGDPDEQKGCDRREPGCDREGRSRPGLADEPTAECRSRRVGDRAGELDPRIGLAELRLGDERGHEGGRRHAERHRAADRHKAEPSQQRTRERPRQRQAEQRQEGERPDGFRPGHQPAARHPVGQEAGRDREEHEGQRQRHLQQARARDPCPEREHGDDGRRGQRHLLGRLRGEVGGDEAQEGAAGRGGGIDEAHDGSSARADATA